MADYRLEGPQAVKDFLRYEKKNKDHTDKTISEYFLDLRTFFRFMKMERGIVPPNTEFEDIDVSDISMDFIRGITKVDINNYVDYLRSDRVVYKGCQNEAIGLSAVSAQRKIASVKSFFAYLCEGVEVLEKNPSIGVISDRKSVV